MSLELSVHNLGNDSLTMISIGRLIAFIAPLFLLYVSAYAGPPLNTSSPRSLCSPGETVLFSCDIGDKKVSLCAINNEGNDQLRVQYRFGRVGGNPEMVYPSKASDVTSSFDFGTLENTTGYPLERISFKIPGADYDILTTDKSDYAVYAPFTGVGVTVRGETTELLACEDNSIIVDLTSLRKALGLSADASLSEVLPRYPIETSPFPIIRRKGNCGRGCKFKIEFPQIPDRAIAAEIKSFIRSKFEGDENGRSVTATIVRGSFLTLSFYDYSYSHGAAHGSGNKETILFS